MNENTEKFELLCQGDSRILKINANRGEAFTVEAGSMVAMTPTFDLKVKAGGLGKMFGRVMSGESALLQEYRATNDGELLLAPTMSGDIEKVELDGRHQYRISNGNFLACSEGITLETKAKIKGIFGSGEGIFGLRTAGAGTLFVNSCGSIHKINLGVGEEYIVDSTHLVLWENDMDFSTELAGGGIGKSLFSGEGFVARFRGPGQIWIQTRKPIVIPTNG
ncbi:MAG: TIGR00266 family protein [Terrisporobacter sp.]